jgi:protocatechuate 3,4-dioxygenase beta subunit
MRISASLAVACAISVASVGAQQQTPRDLQAQTPTGSALVAGIVLVDDTAGRPPRRATVTLAGGDSRVGRQTVTDDRGRFVFDHLAAGRYTLVAEKPGFVRTFYGSRRPGRGPAMPIAVAEAQRLADVTVKLLPGAVIAGTVTDEHGAPIASAQVSARQPLFVSGERTLVEPPSPVQYATTDDRGRYRLYGLPPGEYTVFASGASGMFNGVIETTQAELDAALQLQGSRRGGVAGAAATSPPPSMVSRAGMYFGGGDSHAAELFKLAAGEERIGVDLRLPLVGVGRIEGTITGLDAAQQGVFISIVDATRGVLWASPGVIRPDPDGHFSTPALPAGQYRFVGRTSGRRAPGAPVTTTASTLWMDATVSIDRGDVTGVVIGFERGTTVAGRVAFGGAAPPPTAARLVLAPVGAIAGSIAGRSETVIRADGTFAFDGVAPGRYRIDVENIAPWSLRSAILGDRDTLDAPFEIRAGETIDGLAVTFTDRPSEISGTLFDQLGRPAPEYAVVAFAADRALWGSAPRRLSGAVKLGSDGRFKLTGLPPGEYYIAALIDADPRELNDPSFLEQLIPASIRISLAEAEKKVQDLRLGR